MSNNNSTSTPHRCQSRMLDPIETRPSLDIRRRCRRPAHTLSFCARIYCASWHTKYDIRCRCWRWWCYWYSRYHFGCVRRHLYARTECSSYLHNRIVIDITNNNGNLAYSSMCRQIERQQYALYTQTIVLRLIINWEFAKNIVILKTHCS